MAVTGVLARKWRSSQLPEVVGQQHIVRTLTNAIKNNRVHHAYLFTGSRGIGKTSIARIFSKLLRCENLSEKDGYLVSCDQCASCKEITLGTSLDVIEIDGASNNGVDSVREIRENAKFLPSSGKRRIYIIDEVHMLTTAAFNALLKTLEEPPAHVVFIFATTEPHKIPATILSRCQRYDFRRFTVAQIRSQLEKICKAEKIDAEPVALATLARAADGGMRDALSLLDQVLSYSGGKISLSAVRESIGLVEDETFFKILKSVFEKKPLDALATVNEVHEQGFDLKVLTEGLTEALYSIILLKVGAEKSVQDLLSPEALEDAKKLVDLRELEEMELIFQVLHQGYEWIARSPQPKIVLDVILIKCASAEALLSMEEGPSSNHSSSISGGASHTSSMKMAPAATTAATVSQPSVPATQPKTAPDSKTPAAKSASNQTWEGWIQFVRKSRPILATAFEHSACLDFPTSGVALKVSFNSSEIFYRDQLISNANQQQLQKLSEEFFGKKVRIEIETHADGEKESLATQRERELKERIERARTKVAQHPVIQEAKSLFGADLGPIEVEGQHHG